MSTVYDGSLTDAALADPNNTHAILLRLVGEAQDVLEIGPATGYMTQVMVQRHQCRVTAFEINAAAASAAKVYVQRLIIGDLENPQDLAQVADPPADPAGPRGATSARADGQFDVILIADVLEHLAWPVEPLRTLRGCLRSSGRLIVSLPNVAHWSVRRALLLGRWDLTDRGLMDRTHLRWYTRRTAAALLESAGYRVVRRRCSYAFPAHWRFGLGPRLAAWAQARAMPGTFDDLFALQHIFVAAL